MKKGNGKSIMVSEFLTEVDGYLKLKPEEIEQHSTVPVEAREYLEPGKDREGYWTAENVLNQIKTKAIYLKLFIQIVLVFLHLTIAQIMQYLQKIHYCQRE